MRAGVGSEGEAEEGGGVVAKGESLHLLGVLAILAGLEAKLEPCGFATALAEEVELGPANNRLARLGDPPECHKGGVQGEDSLHPIPPADPPNAHCRILAPLIDCHYCPLEWLHPRPVVLHHCHAHLHWVAHPERRLCPLLQLVLLLHSLYQLPVILPLCP